MTYFDHHDAALLNALGFTQTDYPGFIEEDECTESGIVLGVWEDVQIWTKDLPDGSRISIAVCCDEAEIELIPTDMIQHLKELDLEYQEQYGEDNLPALNTRP